MADALEQAPLKQHKERAKKTEETEFDFLPEYKFDPNKKYMFELAQPNVEREVPVYLVEGRTQRPLPHKEFKPFQNIVFTSQIVWKGQRRNIRYYDGCTSLFTDEQPKDKDLIDQLIRQTKKRNFIEGKFGAYGDERLLLIYLNICSWNVESEFRTRTADAVFKPKDKVKAATKDDAKLDETEKALKLAKEAKESKMMIHAAYLGIPTKDYDSDNDRTEKEIRVDYRKYALQNPASFIDSYGNKSLEIKYYINKALESGIIKTDGNKAIWKSGTVICDISGLRSHEAVGNKLFEFSQLEEGEEFLIQLKSVSE